MPHDLRIESYRGSRDSLRPLFELAEDSAAELDSYIDAGRVLVAVSDGEIIGHLQLTGAGDPRQAEIKNMAVRETLQGQGIGRRLIQAAVDLAAAEAVTTILVATATADIGNLRFYQRQGFRMRSVERDAFTPATGYPPGLLIDGIELRDRVWLDRAVLVRVHLTGDRQDLEVPASDGAFEGTDDRAVVVVRPEHVQRLAVLAERDGTRADP
jgi:GNAT superfamily N-acetyltransferase